MEKKQVILKSGRIIEIIVITSEDGSIDVRTNAEITADEADEIAELV